MLEYYDHGDTAEVDGALTERSDAISIKLRYLVGAGTRGGRAIERRVTGARALGAGTESLSYN